MRLTLFAVIVPEELVRAPFAVRLTVPIVLPGAEAVILPPRLSEVLGTLSVNVLPLPAEEAFNITAGRDVFVTPASVPAITVRLGVLTADAVTEVIAFSNSEEEAASGFDRVMLLSVDVREMFAAETLESPASVMADAELMLT